MGCSPRISWRQCAFLLVMLVSAGLAACDGDDDDDGGRYDAGTYDDNQGDGGVFDGGG